MEISSQPGQQSISEGLFVELEQQKRVFVDLFQFLLLATIFVHELLKGTEIGVTLPAQFQVLVPGHPRLFCQLPSVGLDVLQPHPKDLIDFLGVDAETFIFGDPPSDKEGSAVSVRLKLDRDVGLHAVVYIDPSLFLNFSGCTLSGCFVLVPLPFGEPELVSDSDGEDLGVIFIEDQSPADWLVFLELHYYFPRVDSQTRRGVLCKFCQELISEFFPVLRVAVVDDAVQVIVEGFFCLVGEPVRVLQLSLGQVDYKLGEDLLKDLLFMLI